MSRHRAHLADPAWLERVATIHLLLIIPACTAAAVTLTWSLLTP